MDRASRRRLRGLALAHRDARIRAGLCRANEMRCALPEIPVTWEPYAGNSFVERTTPPLLTFKERVLSLSVLFGILWLVVLALRLA